MNDADAHRSASPACRTIDLSVAYRESAVLENVSIDVPQGVVMGIVGPNGAGKSTLLKAMLGLVQPLTGRAEFFGSTFEKARGRVGYMPQSSSVDWDYPATVFDAVLMGTYGGLGWIRRPGKEERSGRARRSSGRELWISLRVRSANSRAVSANGCFSLAPWCRPPISTSWTNHFRGWTRRASRRS